MGNSSLDAAGDAPRASLHWGVPAALGTVGVFRRKLARLHGIEIALGIRELVLRPRKRSAERLDAVVGWGQRSTTRTARRFAARHELPFVRLEDGFFRSVEPGGVRPLSLICDDRGIYYDASRESLLESWLNAPASLDPLNDAALLERAARVVEFVVEHEISKYNNGSLELPRWLLDETRKMVLVVDQVRGDQSIAGGLADRSSFERMLTAALDEHPNALVVVKIHPDVRFRGKRGHFSARALTGHPAHARIRVLGEPVNPVALLKRVDEVYVCTSQVGFEALLVGKPVHCFGAGFYSGWGLTDDRVLVSRRTRNRTLTELAAAALLLYPRYLHPVQSELCSAEVVLDHLALQRSRFRENVGTTYCFGFTPWKRGFVRSYLKAPGAEVRFVGSAEEAERRGVAGASRFVVWGRREVASIATLAEASGIPLYTMEDGFLRSVGLGSDFTLPASLVLDRRGIYFDPTRQSDLEHLLEASTFTEGELSRARAIRERIVAEGLTKYSLGDRKPLRLDSTPGQRVILVPGQVEDDASIQLGASDTCRTNAALLAAARAHDPSAHLIYRPHPEVLSGNRASQPVPDGAHDQLAVEVPLSVCLEVADEVHTMTSLVGFEALLRGIAVVAHGRPFYAGWGLTTDRVAMPRRTRRLSIDELVAGALLRYPRYYSYSAQAFVTAEDAISELLRERAASTALSSRASRWRRLESKLENLFRDAVHAF